MFTILYKFKDDIIFVLFALKKQQNNLCAGKKKTTCVTVLVFVDDVRDGHVDMYIIFLN